jgi:pyridoxine/pyridoxamine 5'-phosphate oxidase
LITRAALLAFLRSNRYVVESSVHAGGGPQSAVVGVAVSDDFEIVFDTIETSRKAQNLRRRPEIAIVFRGLGSNDERTVQYEGMADEPIGAERTRLVDLYLEVFPDGRDRQTWAGLIYVRAKPTWLRYSDYGQDLPEIVEFDQAGLSELE